LQANKILAVFWDKELDMTDARQESMFSVAEAHAPIGRWLESVLVWLAGEPDCSSSSYASLMHLLPVGFSSRTSLVCCQPAPARDASHHNRQTMTKNPLGSDPIIEDGTSLSCSVNSPDSTPTHPKADGETLVSASDRNGGSHGVCWTLNTSEFPKDAVVCSLSDVLETGPIPAKYFLSPKAATGILRRAENRGRELPLALLRALQPVSESTDPDGDKRQRTRPQRVR
jgi:hypothetical protein